MKSIYYVPLIVLLLAVLLTCDLFEPKIKHGGIAIQFVQQERLAKGAQAAEALSSVRCVLTKGDKAILDDTYNKSGTSFHIDIPDLVDK